MVRPSWSAEYKFAARDVHARWRAPLGIVAALTKNAQGHDTPIVPIKQAWRCAHDRQGQVAALPPSAALDDRYAQTPLRNQGGTQEFSETSQTRRCPGKNSLDTNRPIQVLGRRAGLQGSPREGPESGRKPSFDWKREMGFTAQSRHDRAAGGVQRASFVARSVKRTLATCCQASRSHQYPRAQPSLRGSDPPTSTPRCQSIQIA